ncbi:MAG: bifunctional diaminohydroxyphosphoribosylaminopyrimidine deaminase/5-amino-6-(5-phosphoribosylamino)uracil reductase RibD [Balneolaceae bacterium]
MSSQFTEDDRIWMQRALSLAGKGEGYTSPNPMVGCVIVSESGDVIGEGFHERFGKPHAEVNAVESVQDPSLLAGATLYVTLEPCAHHGKTPPCCRMLGDLPLKRVVVASVDPNPDVNGQGIEWLRNKGIRVDTGLLDSEARRLNEFFFHFQETGRPFVTLKIAQTADGYIAAPDGGSRWITGIDARTLVHQWRSRYDAVMIGRNTASLDNPALTVRHVEGRQPLRIVIDGPYSLPEDLLLFSDQYEEKTIVITHNREKAEKDLDPMLKMMQQNYFRGKVLSVPEFEGHTDLKEAIHALGREGITSVLTEGGQSLSTAMLRAGVVDKLELFIAPKLLGGGTRSVVGLGIDRMEEILKPSAVEWTRAGEDMLLSAWL